MGEIMATIMHGSNGENRLFAIYLGREYEAGIKDDGQIILRSHDTNDINFGFKLYREIVFVKVVPRAEIESVYIKQARAIYKEIEFSIIDERDTDVLLSTMQGDYTKLLGMGFSVVEKGVYHKWINKDEIERTYEVKEVIE